MLRAEAAGELRARYRYLYASPEGLTLRDVSQLLAAYKELAIKYETLAQVRCDGVGDGAADCAANCGDCGRSMSTMMRSLWLKRGWERMLERHVGADVCKNSLVDMPNATSHLHTHARPTAFERVSSWLVASHHCPQRLHLL